MNAQISQYQISHAITLLQLHYDNLLENGLIFAKQKQFQEAIDCLTQVIEITNALKGLHEWLLNSLEDVKRVDNIIATATPDS